MIRFGSVCSGVEAASAAWAPLGWRAAFFSEIDRQAAAVLAHRHPDIPNLGDMTKFQDWPDATIDLLVGGTPCQSFSVAGLRRGLDDPRGNLMLVYLAIARRYRPRWMVWENVPGVLSSNKGRDFGSFLGGLAELGYGFAYRVLDAQFVRVDGFARAVPQRRQRVFVVGYLGDWRRAAAVLFEPEGLRGDRPPRRAAGEGSAVGALAGTSPGGGWRCGADEAAAGHLITMATGQAGAEISIDHGPTLTCNHEAPIVAGRAPELTGSPYGDNEAREGLLVAHTLRAEGFDASEDGTGRGTPIVPVARSVAIRGREGGGTAELGGCVSGTVRASQGGGDKPYVLAPTAFYPAQITSPTNRSNPKPGGPAPTPAPTAGAPAVAFNWHASPSQTMAVDDLSPPLKTTMQPAVMASAVRRLTPRECERLQGFPDDHTRIPLRHYAKRTITPLRPADRWEPDPAGGWWLMAADAPRYKQCGNSMAVNVMRWIGQRIALVDEIGGAP